MTDPISNERLVDALDNLRVHQRQLDADGCEVGVSREALNEVIRAFGELSRRGDHVPHVRNMVELHIVFQNDGGPDNLRFVEVENIDGESVAAGTWIDRPDGLRALALTVHRSDLRNILDGSPCLSVGPAGVEPPDPLEIEKLNRRWHGEDHRTVSVRWEPYKKDGRRQMGVPGRWQEQIGNGDYWRWQNCERPENLTNTDALSSEAHNGQ